MHIGNPIEETQQHVSIINKEKPAKNKRENDGFLRSFYSVYKKLGQFFPHLLANLFKERYISFIKSYKYLDKLIRSS